MTYIPPELDKDAKAMIQSQYESAIGSSPEQMQSTYMKDIPLESPVKGKGLIESSQSIGHKMDDAVGEAIARKANQTYQRGLQGISAQMKRMSTQDDLLKKQRVGSLLKKEQDLNEQIRQAKLKAEQDRKAARAQALGNILGIAGAGIGVAATGTPQGGMAGYAIGSGAGQMAAE